MKILKNKKIVAFVASVLVLGAGIATAIISEQNINGIDEELDDMFEKYDYEQVNANLKTEKALSLAEQLRDGEISFEEFHVELGKVEDMEKPKFANEYFEGEDIQNYNNLTEEKSLWENVGKNSAIVATVAGGAGAIFSFPQKEEEK